MKYPAASGRGISLKALEISGSRVPAYNKSLAGAYAGLDQFDKAIEYQIIAIDIVEERG